MTAVSRIAAALAAAFILLYFLTLSAPGLVTYFNPDDAMNLYGSWVDANPAKAIPRFSASNAKRTAVKAGAFQPNRV